MRQAPTIRLSRRPLRPHGVMWTRLLRALHGPGEGSPGAGGYYHTHTTPKCAKSDPDGGERSLVLLIGTGIVVNAIYRTCIAGGGRRGTEGVGKGRTTSNDEYPLRSDDDDHRLVSRQIIVLFSDP